MAGRVYVSLPLMGPAASTGRELLRGAELALERDAGGVELVVLDAFAWDREDQASANAARAADDPAALAYLGDLHSSQVWATSQVLSPAGLLQVAPLATWTGLHGDSLVRLLPHDGVLAGAIAGWLADAGVERVLVAHDHDDGYGVPVGERCAAAIRERGLRADARPVWDHGEDPARDVEGAGAVLYVGVAGSGAVRLWHGLHDLDEGLWLLGTDGVAAPWLAAALSAGAARQTRFFAAQVGPVALYGLEAMALILDAIAAGGGERAATLQAARPRPERPSAIGTYGIDGDGLTTARACGCLAVVDEQLVWDRQRPVAR